MQRVFQPVPEDEAPDVPFPGRRLVGTVHAIPVNQSTLLGGEGGLVDPIATAAATQWKTTTQALNDGKDRQTVGSISMNECMYMYLHLWLGLPFPSFLPFPSSLNAAGDSNVGGKKSLSRRRVYHDPDPDKLVSPVTGEKIAEYGTWKQDAKRAQLTMTTDIDDEVGMVAAVAAVT